MKTFKTSICPGVAVAVAAVAFLVAAAPAVASEEPSYEVVERDGDLELRRYEPHIVAETIVDTAFDRAGDEGFRRLAGYIFGNNHSRAAGDEAASAAAPASEKIAMTAPVNLHRQDDRYRMTFMMPAAYTLESLPEPLDARVSLRAVPAQLVAAVRYDGAWTRERYDEHRVLLEAWIAQRGWSSAGEPVFARYDAPSRPAPQRRNEVLVPLREEEGPS